jgi:hypothetical protein
MKHRMTFMGLMISLSCLGQNVVIPQDYEAQENLRELGTGNGLGVVRTFDTRYEGVKGSPNVFEYWNPGEVHMRNKGRIAIAQMNYNCFQNEIVYLDPKSFEQMILNKYLVDFFRIFSEDTVLFVSVTFPGEPEPVFAQVLYNRNSQVYKVYKKEFLQANYEGGYSADRRYDEFVDKYDLYFRKHNEDMLYKLRKSVRSINKAFDKHSAEISSFINSHNLKFRSEDELVELMNYYDSL